MCDLKILMGKNFCKTGGDDNFIDGERVFAFDAGEVVKVFPNVIVFSLAQIDFVLVISDYQIVKMSYSNFCLVDLNGAFCDGVMAEGEAMGE